MKFGVVNKSTILNRFVLHTLQRNITHLAVITRKTNIKLAILKGGGGELEKSQALFRIGQIFFYITGEFLKKNRPKRRFKALLDSYDQNFPVFFRRAPPSKLLYIGSKGTFRKTLASTSEKRWFLNNTKEGTFWVVRGLNAAT